MAKVDVQDTSEEVVTADEPVVTTSHNSDQENQKSTKVTRRMAVEALLVLAVVLLGVWVWMLHSDNQDLKNQLTKVQENPQIAVEQQTKELLNDVGQLMQLPQGETPTIATVSDAAKAKKQSAFFANAQDGDKVLMYVKAGQAILYRPSNDKIVLVAPLTFSNGEKATGDDKSANTSPAGTEATDTSTAN